MRKSTKNITSSQYGDFFLQQIREIGLAGPDDERNKIKARNPEADPPAGQWLDISIFSETPQGDLEITYADLSGNLYAAQDPEVKNPKTLIYKRIRLANPDKLGKYRSTAKMGTFPFITPYVRQLFVNGQQCATLFLTEGEKKAFRCSVEKIPVIGLGGITTIREKATGSLHGDIINFIHTCQVKQTVIAFDADCLDIEKNPLQGDDLTKRPRQFFRAIAALREELQKVDPEMIIQFWHTSAPEIGNPKGLDDLINAATNATEFENLMEDFTEFKSGKTRYFQKFNITSSLEKLRDHFAIGKGKAAAEAFFRRHAERIGDETPFNHLGTVYRWDPEKTELVLVTPKWAQDLIWVGDNFFRLVDVPRAHELGAVASIKEMVNVKPTTLTALYGKNYRKFLIDRYYTGFVNIPGHFNYQQQIDRNGNIFYNKYFPFAHHDIRQGNWPYIEKLLRHIFGADPLPGGITTYDMALDYFQILLLYPTERLPVFAAFSPENTTGKSTLANLVIQIFGDNAVSVNAAEFQDKFNDSISSRLLVICDETLIDNDAGMDRLKNLVTAKQVLVNPKGLAKYTIDHFAKYWMFSNRPNMLKVVKYDERFWFRRISAIPKGDQIPDMEQLMASEIPAFLHFLRNRKLVTTKKSRLWFDVSLYTSANPTFADMVEKNEPRDVRQLRHALESIFEESEDDAIFFSREDVKTEIFSGKIDLGRVKDILQDYLGLKPLEKQRYKYPRRTLIAKREDADSGLEETMSIQWIRAQGRPYQFDRKLFENGG